MREKAVRQRLISPARATMARKGANGRRSASFASHLRPVDAFAAKSSLAGLPLASGGQGFHGVGAKSPLARPDGRAGVSPAPKDASLLRRAVFGAGLAQQSMTGRSGANAPPLVLFDADGKSGANGRLRASAISWASSAPGRRSTCQRSRLWPRWKQARRRGGGRTTDRGLRDGENQGASGRRILDQQDDPREGIRPFFGGRYQTGIGGLRTALADSDVELVHLPGHLAPTDFPQTREALAQYDVVVFSDIGANTLLLHPDTFVRGKRTPNRLRLVAEGVVEGGGGAMVGGYYSFRRLRGGALPARRSEPFSP